MRAGTARTTGAVAAVLQNSVDRVPRVLRRPPTGAVRSGGEAGDVHRQCDADSVSRAVRLSDGHAAAFQRRGAVVRPSPGENGSWLPRSVIDPRSGTGDAAAGGGPGSPPTRTATTSTARSRWSGPRTVSIPWSFPHVPYSRCWRWWKTTTSTGRRGNAWAWIASSATAAAWPF